MNDLRDTRRHVGHTATDGRGIKGSYALAASEAVFALLSGNPDVEMTTIRLHVENEYPPRVNASGRVGSLVGPAGDEGELTYVEPLPGAETVTTEPRFKGEPGPLLPGDLPPGTIVPTDYAYACCQQLVGRPHTDYCPTRTVNTKCSQCGTPHARAAGPNTGECTTCHAVTLGTLL